MPGLATAVRSVPTSAASSNSDDNTFVLIVLTGLSPLLGERLASAGVAYGSRLTWIRRRQGRHPKDSDTLEPPGQLRTWQSPASHMPQSFHVRKPRVATAPRLELSTAAVVWERNSLTLNRSQPAET